MGLYSSWAALAYTHHCIIRLAAKRVGFASFSSYAVLGDDVVIWESVVARQYEDIMVRLLGVSISPSKSYVSHNCAEFAKSLFVDGIDVSPLPLELIRLRREYYYQDIVLLLEDLWLRGHRPTWRNYTKAVLYGLDFGVKPEDVYATLTCPVLRVG